MKRLTEGDCELLCIVTFLAVTIISVFSSHLDTLASL
jgi:hypothetical protein